MQDQMTGADLKRWRQVMDWTGQSAAEALGISHSAISKFEVGARVIPYYCALACTALYVDPERELPGSMRETRLALDWSQAQLSVALGYYEGPVTIWQMEAREAAGIPVRRPVMLALAALIEGLLPWHRF